MAICDLLAQAIGGETARLIAGHASALAEIRLRIGREAQLKMLDGRRISAERIEPGRFAAILNLLMENSLYARERELMQGYFTSVDGCRVGICGKINAGRNGIDSIADIGAVCIRIPRQVKGCASLLADCMRQGGRGGMLILSPPGMGKSTMLRDLVRILSDDGMNVAVVDERREIAACVQGCPQLDVGACTDVMDGLQKFLAIPMLVRACAPDIIAVDELGGMQDAQALMEAVRCGVSVIATAHAGSLQDAMRRSCMAALMQGHVFAYYTILGNRPGQIKTLRRCANEGFSNAEGDIAGDESACLHGSGKIAVQCAKAQV